MMRDDLSALMTELQAAGRRFVVATVVRTIAATSAKPGAKAVVTEDGEVHGWIGGGCTLGAVRAAAKKCLAEGRPKLVSVVPFDELKAEGIRHGEVREGVEYARNMCPSRGTVDLFLEPVLPRAALVVLGGTPVARAVADLASRIGLVVAVHAEENDREGFASADRFSAGYDEVPGVPADAFVVVATQGRDDIRALGQALKSPARFVAMVASRAKVASLKEHFLAEGISQARLDQLIGPAGVAIGAVTPEEIALSIVAEVVRARRLGSNADAPFREAAA